MRVSVKKKGGDVTYAVNPRTATAVETIRRYAGDHRLLVWDMYDVAGGKKRACKNWTEAKLMRPDHVHYLPEGYTCKEILLYQALIKSIQRLCFPLIIDFS